jgi:hypothetical protein
MDAGEVEKDGREGGVAADVAGSESGGGRLAAAGGAAVSVDPGSGASRFSIRTLPVWLSVRTGSASAISCSIFLMGAAGWRGTAEGIFIVRVACWTGARRTTPCMAGNVRVPVPLTTGVILAGAGVAITLGSSAAGSGFIVGG